MPIKTRTAARRHNDKMDRIFRDAEANKRKYAPENAVEILRQMTSAIKKMNAMQHAGMDIPAGDWAQLHQLANSASGVLELIPPGGVLFSVPAVAGVRLGQNGAYVPTINGKDTSPESFDKQRALEIAREQIATATQR